MGYKTHLFGSENPAGVVKVVNAGMLVLAALALHGVWVDVVPANELTGPIGAGVALGIGFTMFAALLAAGVINGTSRMPKNPVSMLVVLVGGILMMGLFAYPVVTRSVPWIHAAAFGEARSVETMMWSEGGVRKNSCDYRLKGGPLVTFLGRHLCTSPEFYRQYPDRLLRVRLHGQESALGFRITGFEVIEVLGPT